MARQPTPQSISALLRKAGFERSVSKPTRIKGWREWSDGYKVTRRGNCHVQVEYQPSSFRARETPTEQIKAQLGKYREAIQAGGFDVEDGESVLRVFLIVSAPEEA